MYRGPYKFGIFITLCVCSRVVLSVQLLNKNFRQTFPTQHFIQEVVNLRISQNIHETKIEFPYWNMHRLSQLECPLNFLILSKFKYINLGDQTVLLCGTKLLNFQKPFKYVCNQQAQQGHTSQDFCGGPSQSNN